MSRRHRAVKREILPDAKFGDVVITRAVYFMLPAWSCTEFWPSTTWLFVTTTSRLTKNPLPRAVPVSASLGSRCWCS